MNQIFTAIFVDSETNNIIYRLNQKNVWNKFFWEKEKLLQLDRLSKTRDIPKSQIIIRDVTTYETNEQN